MKINFTKIKEKINIKTVFQFSIIVCISLFIGALISQLTPLLVIALIISAVFFVFIIERPIWGIYILALLLPFERIGSYDISGITIRPSQIIFIITFICWIIWCLLNKKFNLSKNPIFWPTMIFIGINFLAIINAPNPERSFMVLFFTIFTIFISFLVPNLIKNKKSVKKIIIFFLIGYMIVISFGLFQFFGDIIGLPTSITGLREHYTKDVLGFPRIQSTSLEPLYFANYLLIPISVLLAVLLSKASKMKSLHLIILFIIGLVNLILTVSRGGYIAIIVSLAVVLIFMYKKLFKPKNILIILIILILVISLSVRFLNLDDSMEKFREHTFSVFYGASYYERLYTYEQSMTMFYQHPIIGQGPGSFGTFVSAHPYIIPPDGWAIVNNETLEILAETGILGLLAMFIIIIIIIFRSLKAIQMAKEPYYKALLIGLLAAFCGILVQYQTFSILYITHIWFLIGLIIALQNIILNKKCLKQS